MATHIPCGKSWTGATMEHCPACCETFTDTTAGDQHRVGDWDSGTRRCLTVAEMMIRGLRQLDNGSWKRARTDTRVGVL